MGRANPNQPTIDTSTGDGEYHWRSKNFSLQVNCNFATLGSLPNPRVVKGSDAGGRTDSYKSIGQFNGADVFKIEPLNSHWGAQHHSNGRTADGARDRAWYNKVYNDVVKVEGGNLTIGGKVIGSRHPEYSNDYASADANKNFCSGWLDSLWDPPDNVSIPSPAPPNLTIEKDSFTEICVSFEDMRSEGHRLSLWLMPATINNNPGTTALFQDPGEYQNTAYNDTDPFNGVEIDIFEHEYSASVRDLLLMKAILSAKDLNFRFTNNAYGQLSDSQNGVSSSGGDNTNVEYQHVNEGFHRIGFLWSGFEMIWFLNGRPVVKDVGQGAGDPSRNPQNARQYLLLTREYGNVLAGPPLTNTTLLNQNAAFNNDKVKIKYVKVWKVLGRSTARALPKVRQPEQLHGWPSGSSSIQLRWGKSIGAVKYKVYRNNTYISTVSGSTTYLDTGRSAGRTYSYEVEGISSNDSIVSTRSHIAYVRAG